MKGDVLSFISTTMNFRTPVDVTPSELALETFFPADDLTARRMREMAARLAQRTRHYFWRESPASAVRPIM